MAIFFLANINKAIRRKQTEQANVRLIKMWRKKAELMNMIVFNILGVIAVCLLVILLIIYACVVIESLKDTLKTISPDRNNGWLTKPIKQFKCGAIYGHDWQTISTICSCTRCGKIKKFKRK